MNVAERRIPQDGSFSYESMGETIDIRVSSLPTAFGEKIGEMNHFVVKMEKVISE
jgi:type IV pilus assembly protein PilB